MIKVSKRHYEIIADFMETNSYTITATNFNLSTTRVREIHQKLSRYLRKYDPYMQAIFDNKNWRSFYKTFQQHPKAIKECFYRIVEIKQTK